MGLNPRSGARMSMVWHFCRARWLLHFTDRARLERWQTRQLARFVKRVLPRAPRYAPFAGRALNSIPYTDKASMMADFAGCNTRGVALEEALEVAMRAEASRDFAPRLGDLTVGLSSGSSGRRGVFLVSDPERMRWAGVVLARALPRALLTSLLAPWTAPLRIAFFLRANSNLYTALGGARVRFDFYDLVAGMERALPRLARSGADVLVAPATVLRALAGEVLAGRLELHPRHVVSVAEVLEDSDVQAVKRAFGAAPHSLYQATEGFLAYSCEYGTLHLNECYVHFDEEWLDAARTRFHPVITDFSRETQLIVRYRLDDVLRLASAPCPCGRAERALAAIEGRADEVLWLPSARTGASVAVFPDTVRRAMMLASTSVREYTIRQAETHWQVDVLTDALQDKARADIAGALERMCNDLGVLPPPIRFGLWQSPQPGVKRRRIAGRAREEALQ